jgi:glycosyltransferase involved in cell wall biosynthesis
MKISVVIPTYNRGAAIEKTVDSVLAQDLPLEQVEIIIVDDGSTDDTWAVLNSLYAQNPQVRLFRTENGGVANARNFGWQQAHGEFIAYLDHDDLWKPAKLRLQLAAMQSSEKIGVVYCSWVSVNEEGQEMPPIIQFQRQWWWRPHNGVAFPWILLPHPLQFIRNPIISMTIPLIRTRFLREIGGFDAGTVPSDDWDLWIRLAHKCDFACVNQELALYVHHNLQQHKQMKAAYTSALQIYAKHKVPWLKHPWVRFKQECYRRTCRAMIHHAEAKEALFQGNRRRVFVSTLQAIVQRPDTPLLRRWHRLWMRALRGNTERF